MFEKLIWESNFFKKQIYNINFKKFSDLELMKINDFWSTTGTYPHRPADTHEIMNWNLSLGFHEISDFGENSALCWLSQSTSSIIIQ